MEFSEKLPPRRRALALGLALAMGLAPAAQAESFAPRGGVDINPALIEPEGWQLRSSTIDDSGELGLWQAQLGAGLLESVIQRGGATHVVTNCNDSGPGSLPLAVNIAASGDVVDMSSLSCSTITLDGPLVLNQDSLTLRSDGGTFIDASASNNAGLIYHAGTGSLVLDGLWLRHGHKYASVADAQRHGGCVSSQGDVLLSHTQVKYCQTELVGTGSTGKGGAIYAAGNVSMSYSNVLDSSVTSTNYALGGGIYAGGGFLAIFSDVNGNTATATSGMGQAGGVLSQQGFDMKYSTIAENAAGRVGGAIAMQNGPTVNVTIAGSTISDNDSTSFDSNSSAGLWVLVDGNVNISDSTIVFNQDLRSTPEMTGAGLFITGSPNNISLNRTIVAGNAVWDGVGGNAFSDLKATGFAVTGGHNLVGVTPPGTTIPDDTIRTTYPELGPLQNNDGWSMSRIPAKGSWTINQGGTAGPDLDQSGDARLVGARIDIGSEETDTLFLGRFEEANRGGG